jgi:hypothetical protein
MTFSYAFKFRGVNPKKCLMACSSTFYLRLSKHVTIFFINFYIEELRAQIQKNALAVRKELLAVPSQQIANLQPNTKTRLDIRYPTVGLHKTK